MIPSISGFLHIAMKKNIDSSGKSKTERMDINRLRQDITKDTKIRTKGRLVGGQSKHGHSSVYE
jgi:hypothetical protein